MVSPRPIALLTDFGDREWYVGAMKGVIAALSPRTPVIDLTHQIPPGDISSADFVLESAYSHFPEGTIFCCVVDPGVGSERRALAATNGTTLFVGPDNGLFTSVARLGGDSWQVREATNRDLFLPEISPTFHGRDLFSPLAAHLSNGTPLEEAGPSLQNFIALPSTEPTRSDEKIHATVRYIDRFGNLFTSLRESHLEELPGFPKEGGRDREWTKRIRLRINRTILEGLSSTFSDRPEGSLLLYPGSSGYLEIAVNRGSAAHHLRAAVGTPCEFFLA